MYYIKEIIDQLDEEIDGAKKYAERYVKYKAKNNMQWANRFKEMANDEIKHCNYIHELVVFFIEELKKIYSPPAEMLEKWEHEHKEYVEKVAWIKQMLTM